MFYNKQIQPQWDRIETNLKIIWGSDITYDVSFRRDENFHYQCICFIRKGDRGPPIYPPIIETSFLCSKEEGVNELEGIAERRKVVMVEDAMLRQELVGILDKAIRELREMIDEGRRKLEVLSLETSIKTLEVRLGKANGKLTSAEGTLKSIRDLRHGGEESTECVEPIRGLGVNDREWAKSYFEILEEEAKPGGA